LEFFSNRKHPTSAGCLCTIEETKILIISATVFSAHVSRSHHRCMAS
jgi:hypothetical protein